MFILNIFNKYDELNWSLKILTKKNGWATIAAHPQTNN